MPGTLIRERSTKTSRSLPTDTGMFFLAGMSDKGSPADSLRVLKSVADFEKWFGLRTSYSSAWDMVDGFFGEGGSSMMFARVLGPAPTTAGATLNDGTAVAALRVTATSPGAWANTRNVAVIAGDAGGEFKLVFTDDVDLTYIETSPSFVDQTAAIAYYATHDLYRVSTLTSANDPAVVAAVSFTGGADDRTNATDATWLAALNLFTRDLGPGQVAYAARTTTVAHGQLLDHADANNRRALVDPPDGILKSGFLTAVSSDRLLANPRRGALFAPWLNLPALTFGGATRAVPASCIAAGVMARNDGRGLSPDDPAAGDNGILQYAASLRATGFTTQDLTDLNEGGVNMIIVKNGDMRIYGYRTLVPKATFPLHWQLGNGRLYMAIAAKADNILETFVLKKIDGRGLIFKDLEGKLSAMLAPYWADGSLYGEELQDAFFVDTGPTVNTVDTINAGEIHAVIELTMSPMGETVILDIVRRAVGS